MSAAYPARRIVRFLGRALVLVGLAGIVAKVFVGAQLAYTSFALTSGFAVILLDTGILALRRLVPAARVALPIVFLIASIGFVGWLRPIIGAVLLVLELFIIAQALRASKREQGAKSIEDHLTAAFSAVVPAEFARFLACEVAVVRAAIVDIFSDAPRGEPVFSYTKTSVLGISAVILAVGTIPDTLVVDILLPHHLLWLKVLLNAAAIYALIWLVGTHALMRLRPHTVDVHDASVWLMHGVLNEARLPFGDIVSCEPISFASLGERLKYRHRYTTWRVPGAPMVRIQLRRRLEYQSITGAVRTRDPSLTVAVDEPRAFCTRLAIALQVARHSPGENQMGPV